MTKRLQLMIQTPNGHVAEYSDERGQTHGFDTLKAAELFARKELGEMGRMVRAGDLPDGDYRLAVVKAHDPEKYDIFKKMEAAERDHRDGDPERRDLVIFEITAKKAEPLSPEMVAAQQRTAAANAKLDAEIDAANRPKTAEERFEARMAKVEAKLAEGQASAPPRTRGRGPSGPSM